MTPERAVALLLATCALSAGAQPAAWRCGSEAAPAPLYTDRPCPGGRPVEAPALPSAGERSQALETARREQALAVALRDERLRREAAAPRGYPAGIRMPAAEVRRENTVSPGDTHRRDGRPRKHTATTTPRHGAPSPPRGLNPKPAARTAAAN